MGRYIAKEILNRFKQDKKITAYGLDKLLDPFESIVEMACLMHDIGNPPSAILVSRRSITGLPSRWIRMAEALSLEARIIVRSIR